MIKGVGFGNGLKQLFSIGLISCFMFLGSFFVNSSYTSPVGTYTDSFDTNYSVNIISRGSFLSQYIGNTRDILWIGNNNFYMWTEDGRLYSHLYGNLGYGSVLVEGYVQFFHLCDTISGTDYFPSNCSSSSYSSGFILPFLKSVKNGQDNYAFSQVYEENNERGFMWFCIDSNEYQKSLCFFTQYHRVGGCPSIGGVCEQLADSVGLGYVNFGDINGYPSPAVDGTIVGGDSSAVIGTLGGNQNYIQCTLNTALHWYNYKGYSEKLCYGGLDNYNVLGTDDFIPIYGQGIYLTDLYNNTKSLRAKGHTGTEMSKSEWFSYWRNLYKGYKNGMYSTNPFSDNPAVLFTYFGAVDVYGGAFDNDSILEYCKISSHDGSLSALYSGVNYNSVCNWSPISVVQDTVEGELSGTGYNEWANGDVSIGASWDGVISGGITFTNGKTFISDSFNRLKDNFLFPVGNGGVFGVLPGYIILSMLGLILFRFLSH